MGFFVDRVLHELDFVHVWPDQKMCKVEMILHTGRE